MAYQNLVNNGQHIIIITYTKIFKSVQQKYNFFLLRSELKLYILYNNMSNQSKSHYNNILHIFVT